MTAPAAHAQAPGYHWGDNSGGQSDPLSGDFVQVSAGGYHTCGVRSGGQVECWGSNEMVVSCPADEQGTCYYVYTGQANPPAGVLFTQVSAGEYHTCGVTVAGNVDCWGNNADGEAADRTGNYLEVSAGEGHTCALRSDFSVDCWGNNGKGRAEGRPGPFTHVSAGGSHNCAIRQVDGKLECWGANGYGQSTPPNFGFVQVSAGNLYTCGLTTDDTLSCWGYNFYGQVGRAPAGAFKQVDSGQGHACAITSANEVRCWGRNDYGQANVPGLGGPAVTFDFEGFFPPLKGAPTLNVVKVGSAVPLKFSLGGDRGLAVIAAGYPASASLDCATLNPGETFGPAKPAGGSGLTYDAASGQYTYVWKTEKTWAGTCRVLSLRLTDETEHRAAFKFK